MDFRLKVFISVAEHLSYTAASRELMISQPAITRHIQELEGSYGVALFQRKGRSIGLTGHGKVLLEHAKRIIKAYDMLQCDMDLLNISCAGPLAIGVENILLSVVATSVFPAFMERFPQVELDILSGRREFVVDAVAGGKADFAFVQSKGDEECVEYLSMEHLGLGYIAKQPGKDVPQLGALIQFAGLLSNKTFKG